MNIFKLFKKNKQTSDEKILLEESDIFTNLTKHQLERVMKRIELELADIEKKEEELRASSMPF